MKTKTPGTPGMEELIKRMVTRQTGALVSEAKIEKAYWYVLIEGQWIKVSDHLKGHQFVES